MSDWVICHHGIKGMRWGRRRYQNEDGSLTSAGAARYMDGDGGFRWGEHTNESRMNPIARVATTAGRIANRIRGVNDAVERSGLGSMVRKVTERQEQPRHIKQTESRPATAKRTKSKSKMTPEQKKAMAKKIAIGVGIVGLAAASAYVISKSKSKQSPQSFVERMLENQEFEKSQNRRLENMHNAWKKGILTDAQFQERHNAIIRDSYRRAKGLI